MRSKTQILRKTEREKQTLVTKMDLTWRLGTGARGKGLAEQTS